MTTLSYYLVISGTATQIDEPVDFDNMKLTMRRDPDYHGISAEFSESTLTFYGEAATLIQTAYNASIDTDITFRVLSGAATFYEGKLDLSTYEEKDGAYFAVTCKVGEIGVKTTFNNRTETEIDLLGNKTMGEQQLTHVPVWKNLPIPPLTLIYTNSLTTDDVVMMESTVPSGRFHLPANKSYHFISLNLAERTSLNEFGDFNTGFADIADQITPQTTLADEYIDDYYQPFFSREEIDTFKAKYGENATYNIDIDLTIGLTFSSALFPETVEGGTAPTYIYTGKYVAELVLLAPHSTFGNPLVLIHGSRKTLTNSSEFGTTLFQIRGSMQGINISALRLGILLENQTTYHTNADPTERRANVNYQVNVIAQTFSGESITMTLNSRMDSETTYAELLPVHEALNAIVENISDNALTVKSTYYGRCDSQVNPIAGTNTFGGGSLKAITSGYKLRNGHQSATYGTKQMPISFKAIIESLDAIDCIGWGFTTENNQTCLRVERWDYFYNNQPVLTLSNPNSVTKTIDTDRIITELVIGYKKYVTNEEMNSAMSIHSEQTYSNRCKAIKRQKSRLCSFIADFYAIEQTRRKQFAIDTKEFKYDDNIFVLELVARDPSLTGGSIGYGIPTGYIILTSGMIGSDLQKYNMIITPHRNAYRWQEYLRWINQTKEFICVSTKQNASASFQNYTSSFLPSVHFLDYASNMTHAEKGDLNTLETTAKMRKEIVKITYPLTLAQYQSLRANPYGLINVDGMDYWLQEASYELKTGKTDLKLIPKNN